MRHRQRDAEDGVGAQLRFVGRAVQRDERRVHPLLVLGWHPGQRRCDQIVDVGDGFEDALATLPVRDLNLLRCHFLEGLTTAELGDTYAVHKATVARWLRRARTTVLSKTRRNLMIRLKVDRAEFDTIVRSLGSQMDVTLQKIWGDS